MLALFESAVGFALFKIRDGLALEPVDHEALDREFSSPESARNVVDLKAFLKFENVSEALIAMSTLPAGIPSGLLLNFLDIGCNKNESLAVADETLGSAIQEKLRIPCVHNEGVTELLRGVRSQIHNLLGHRVSASHFAAMTLAFSRRRRLPGFDCNREGTLPLPICELDRLNKDINLFAMRVREWYGWHFPELAKMIPDKIKYVRAVKLIGDKVNLNNAKFKDDRVNPEYVDLETLGLSDDDEAELRETAVISMGNEISALDLLQIRELCDQVIKLIEEKAPLNAYVQTKMQRICNDPDPETRKPEFREGVGERLTREGVGEFVSIKGKGSTQTLTTRKPKRVQKPSRRLIEVVAASFAADRVTGESPPSSGESRPVPASSTKFRLLRPSPASAAPSPVDPPPSRAKSGTESIRRVRQFQARFAADPPRSRAPLPQNVPPSRAAPFPPFAAPDPGRNRSRRTHRVTDRVTTDSPPSATPFAAPSPDPEPRRRAAPVGLIPSNSGESPPASTVPASTVPAS